MKERISQTMAKKMANRDNIVGKIMTISEREKEEMDKKIGAWGTDSVAYIKNEIRKFKANKNLSYDNIKRVLDLETLLEKLITYLG
jgi:hypothetical protein